MLGKLYLIPTPLGDNATHTIPQYAIDIVHKLDEFIAERPKTARRFLKSIGTPIPFADMTFFELNKRTQKEDMEAYLTAIQQGKSIGLLSEAGCPGIADPGADIVSIAHRKGIEIVPLIGPSSILLALMASGMNGQQFAFVGYINVKPQERIKDLKRLEQQAIKYEQSQIMIETPYRNNKLIEDMFKALSQNTRLCIAMDISLPTEYIVTKTMKNWKKTTLPNLHKRPAIFIIGR